MCDFFLVLFGSFLSPAIVVQKPRYSRGSDGAVPESEQDYRILLEKSLPKMTARNQLNNSKQTNKPTNQPNQPDIDQLINEQ
jgi:hypothetical protein